MNARILLSALVLTATACSGMADRAAPRAPGEPLRIASWNIEHLAERNGSGCRPRTDADYRALRDYVEALDADVVAFQEVESKAAAERVFEPSEWTVLIEQRTGSAQRGECGRGNAQRLNAQRTGFAIRKGLPFDRQPLAGRQQQGDPCQQARHHAPGVLAGRLPAARGQPPVQAAEEGDDGGRVRGECARHPCGFGRRQAPERDRAGDEGQQAGDAELVGGAAGAWVHGGLLSGVVLVVGVAVAPERSVGTGPPRPGTQHGAARPRQGPRAADAAAAPRKPAGSSTSAIDQPRSRSMPVTHHSCARMRIGPRTRSRKRTGNR